VKLLIKRLFFTLEAVALLTLFCAASDAVFGADPSKSGKAVRSVKADEEFSSAQSAVSLIELIKQRLRSLPQLAVNNTKQTIAFQSQEAGGRPVISADPHLLIKPKDGLIATSSLVWERSTDYKQSATQQNVVSQSPLVTEFDIALVPPTIVNGIPAVTLGSSAKEATQSITTLGRIGKQHFDDWTVWSVYKAKEKSDSKKSTAQTNLQAKTAGSCRLQVFMQAGMVEAIRVFDASLLRSNLGITLGDDLVLIKHKFGEPAFILAEPDQRISQNYIYPINQVGFQLERLKNDEAPKIVSVLIFNAR
jgi:hypothetical protein